MQRLEICAAIEQVVHVRLGGRKRKNMMIEELEGSVVNMGNMPSRPTGLFRQPMVGLG
jgi:hypothetical protein